MHYTVQHCDITSNVYMNKLTIQETNLLVELPSAYIAEFLSLKVCVFILHAFCLELLKNFWKPLNYFWKPKGSVKPMFGNDCFNKG